MEYRLRYGLRRNLLDRLGSGLSLRLRSGRYCPLEAILRGRGGRRLSNRPCDGLRCRLRYGLSYGLACWLRCRLTCRYCRSRSRSIAGN